MMGLICQRAASRHQWYNWDSSCFSPPHHPRVPGRLRQQSTSAPDTAESGTRVREELVGTRKAQLEQAFDGKRPPIHGVRGQSPEEQGMFLPVVLSGYIGRLKCALPGPRLAS
jgi:hypothetical protein